MSNEKENQPLPSGTSTAAGSSGTAGKKCLLSDSQNMNKVDVFTREPRKQYCILKSTFEIDS